MTFFDLHISILPGLFYVFRTKYLTVYDIRPLMSCVHRFPIIAYMRSCVCVFVCVYGRRRLYIQFTCKHRGCSPEQYRSRFIIQQTVRICFLMETKHIHSRAQVEVYTSVHFEKETSPPPRHIIYIVDLTMNNG